MRAFEIITEASGGIARRWVEKQSGKDIHFLDQQGNRWDLEGVSFFPADPDLAYITDEESSAVAKLQTDLNEFLQSQGLKQIKTFGEKSAGSKSVAAMIVIVTDGTEKAGYILQVRSKKGVGANPIMWDNTKFMTDTGLTVQTAQMKKAVVPIEPSDIFQPGAAYTPEQIIETTSKNIQDKNIPEQLKTGIPTLLQNVSQGKIDPVPGLKEHEPVIQVKFGEIAAPIALVTGNLVGGAYAQANEQLLKPLGGSWQSSSGIIFAAKGEELVDSYIRLPGGDVGISSKAGTRGAKPSLKSIVETLNTKAENFSDEFLNNNSELIKNMTVLHEQSAIGGVMTLAAQLEIINKDDVAYVSSIYGKGPADPAGMTPNISNLVKTSSYQKVETNNPEYQLGYHVLAVIARKVADEFNKDKARITEFFKAVLNNANMVQVMAKTSSRGDGVAYSRFDVIWPPVFAGTIQTYAGHYTSRTRPTRKISFEFK